MSWIFYLECGIFLENSIYLVCVFYLFKSLLFKNIKYAYDKIYLGVFFEVFFVI